MCCDVDIKHLYIHHPRAVELIDRLSLVLPRLPMDAINEVPQKLCPHSALIAFNPPAWVGSRAGNATGSPSEEINEEARAIKWVHCSGAGVDGIEAVFQLPKPVVTRTLGSLGRQLGSYVLTYLLYHHQRVEKRIELARKKIWAPESVQPRSLEGQRVVILGTGACAQAIARTLASQEMEVIGVSKSGRARPAFNAVNTLSDLPSLLAQADALVMALPQAKSTYHLIQARHFEQAQGLLVINIGRGSVIAEQDLLQAKRSGRIGMLVLDVFEQEPLALDSPFWSEPHVYVTPHVAAVTRLQDIVLDFLSAGRDLGVEFGSA